MNQHWACETVNESSASIPHTGTCIPGMYYAGLKYKECIDTHSIRTYEDEAVFLCPRRVVYMYDTSARGATPPDS